MMASLLYLCTHSHVVSGLGSQSGGQPVLQEFKVVLGGLHYENPEEQIIQDPVVPLPSPLKKPIQVSRYTVHVFSMGFHFFRKSGFRKSGVFTALSLQTELSSNVSKT